MKYVIYNSDGTVYDVLYAMDGWTYEKCVAAYYPREVEEFKVNPAD